ncbi:galactan beta-1,4-galactosyltransferase GALS1 isoform X2 [Silene latifolia]|uniref:galactan beta-1,4-galactosyltransferase GALS1 isoform X2 n=1 Tax=Silene latifolia TaxID=37657 RepID=UPI003D785244
MKKDGASPPPTGGVTGNSVTKFFLCFETKPLLATVLALSLIMFISTFLPYYHTALSPSPSRLSPPVDCTPLQTLLNRTAFLSVGSSKVQLNNPIPNSNPNQDINSMVIEQNSTQDISRTLDVGSRKVQLSNQNLNSNPNPDPNKRVFKPYGNAAALFVTMGAYRGGVSSFTVVGLASKPVHVFGKPWYKCEWIPSESGSAPVRSKAVKILPDWGYGRVYTVVVVNCEFTSNPNPNNLGGTLMLYAYYSASPRRFEKFPVLEESPGDYNEAKYVSPPQLDYLYCGSSLYGNLSAARIREWMAYHAWLFGPKSHFVFHDAGGVTDEVRAVLEPWIKLGRATLQDIREQEKYDGYYYNQFLVVNDCLHRYRFDAKWTFFYDVDEYIFLPDGSSLESIMKGFDGVSQFTIEQNPMSSKLCLNDSTQDYSRQWGFEKLLFRDSRIKIRRDRKYAIQARKARATGVHMSENVAGKTRHDTESKIRYYHYHNTIQVKEEPCRVFLPPSAKKGVTMFEKLPYVYDVNMKKRADMIKQFERQTLGTYQHPS